MDQENIRGAAQKIKGKIEEVAGKALGDKDLELHGKADQLGRRRARCGGNRKRDTVKTRGARTWASFRSRIIS